MWKKKKPAEIVERYTLKLMNYLLYAANIVTRVYPFPLFLGRGVDSQLSHLRKEKKQKAQKAHSLTSDKQTASHWHPNTA